MLEGFNKNNLQVVHRIEMRNLAPKYSIILMLITQGDHDISPFVEYEKENINLYLQ